MPDSIFLSVSARRHRLRGPLLRVMGAVLAAFALVPELARAIG